MFLCEIFNLTFVPNQVLVQLQLFNSWQNQVLVVSEDIVKMEDVYVRMLINAR